MSNRMLHLSRSLLQKNFWVLQLSFLISMVFLGAVALTSFAEGYLAKYEVTTPPAGSNTPMPDDEADEYIDFGSLFPGGPEAPTPPIPGPTTPGPGMVVEERVPITNCADSEIPALLVGTVAGARGDWSHGIIRDCTSNQTRLVGVGDEIGEAIVLHVTRNRLCFQIDERPACLRAGDTEPYQREASVGPPVETPLLEDETEQTTSFSRPVSPSHWEIRRSAIEEAMRDPGRFASDAPEIEQVFNNDGRPSGVRIASSRPGSLPSLLGLRRGDIVREVNGIPVRTPQTLSELPELLETESQIEVVVVRRNRERTLTYDII